MKWRRADVHADVDTSIANVADKCRSSVELGYAYRSFERIWIGLADYFAETSSRRSNSLIWICGIATRFIQDL